MKIRQELLTYTKITGWWKIPWRIYKNFTIKKTEDLKCVTFTTLNRCRIPQSFFWLMAFNRRDFDRQSSMKFTWAQFNLRDFDQKSGDVLAFNRFSLMLFELGIFWMVLNDSIWLQKHFFSIYFIATIIIFSYLSRCLIRTLYIDCGSHHVKVALTNEDCWFFSL